MVHANKAAATKQNPANILFRRKLESLVFYICKQGDNWLQGEKNGGLKTHYQCIQISLLWKKKREKKN